MHSYIKKWYFTGIRVNYAAEVAGLPAGPALLRCIILLWTGDYPANSEVGKFICHEVRPCRRCELKGKYLKLWQYHM